MKVDYSLGIATSAGSTTASYAIPYGRGNAEPDGLLPEAMPVGVGPTCMVGAIPCPVDNYSGRTMCIIRFGDDQAEFLALTVHGRSNPDAADYRDGNWLWCTAEVSGGVPGEG